MANKKAIVSSSVGVGNWTEEQLKLAFHLYCQLTFGKLHSKHPKIIELAALIKRTPSATAMKLSNFASLDPSITNSGRVGLSGASKMDRKIWNEFNADWERLAIESEQLRRNLIAETLPTVSVPAVSDIVGMEDTDNDFTGETKTALVQLRIKQSFFRRMVLSSYRGRCCISGLSEPSLLVASHIVPWRSDKANRLNPRNGLCLSVIHDKAFDKGLITISDDFRVLVSRRLLERKDDVSAKLFHPLVGRKIEAPEKFGPGVEFIKAHRELFVEGAADA